MTDVKYTIITPSMCPNCGYYFDCATHAVHGDRVPKPDDFTICVGCASVLRFNKNMTVRDATIDDIMDLHPKQRQQLKMMVLTTAAAIDDRKESEDPKKEIRN